jgi:hypothetical protein
MGSQCDIDKKNVLMVNIEETQRRRPKEVHGAARVHQAAIYLWRQG